MQTKDSLKTYKIMEKGEPGPAWTWRWIWCGII